MPFMQNAGKESDSIFLPVLPMVTLDTVKAADKEIPLPTPTEKTKPFIRFLSEESDWILFGGLLVERLLQTQASSEGRTLNEPTEETIRELKVRTNKRRDQFLQETGAESPLTWLKNPEMSPLAEMGATISLMPQGQNFEEENPEIFRLVKDLAILFIERGNLSPRDAGLVGVGAYRAYEAYKMQAEKDRGKA